MEIAEKDSARLEPLLIDQGMEDELTHASEKIQGLKLGMETLSLEERPTGAHLVTTA
jgi:hypothetical protein